MPTKTIELRGYEVDGKKTFIKKEAMEVLNILHHCTFDAHLKILGITKRLGWQEIREILALKLFLNARNGYHSRTMYANLRSIPGALDKVFDHYGIDVDQEFRRIYEQYNQRTQSQNQYQISNAIPRRRGADGRFRKSRQPKQRRAS